MSKEEEKRCPLCAEEMDWTDQQLKPCKCGYEVCIWCWHHIMGMAEKDATEGRCPACRTPYDNDRIVGLKSNFQRVAANSCSRKQKQPKVKQKLNEVRKDLSNVRVIQRKMAYIIGLPLSLADEDLLQRKDYFGQYGKVTKVSLSRTSGGTVQQFANDTCSVYITYSKEEEAVRCIQSVHGYVLDGLFLRASFGTAKYCHAWLRNTPCNNIGCLYLHNIGAEEDSFGKDETAAVHTRNRVQEIVGAAQYLHKRSGSMLPPPVDEHLSNHSVSPEESVFNSNLKDVAYASGDHKDAVVRSSKHMTSFVDIVGRSCNSASDKDTSSVPIDISNHDKGETSDLVSLSPGKLKLYSEPFREASKLADLTLKDTNNNSNNNNYSDDPWWECSSENDVNSYADEGFKQNYVLNGQNEKGFQSLTKSDRVYRGSKSFSNEEIVEHLRRLHNDDDRNSAAVESSIILNILSMDFDDSGSPQTVAGLFEKKDLWKFQNSDQSRFSFANEDSGENQGSIYKPQYQASMAQNVAPPGFSKPPPGFPSCMRTEQVVSASTGSYVKNCLSNNHYRVPSIGSLSNSSDDPAITGPYFDNNTNLWLLMQQQQSVTHNHLKPNFSQTSSMQQHHMSQFPCLWDDYYGEHRQQSYNQQHYLQPKFANGHNTSNGYQHSEETQQFNSISEVGLQEQIQRNERRLGLDKLLPGYVDDYMFQMPSSGDVYTRVFGM